MNRAVSMWRACVAVTVAVATGTVSTAATVPLKSWVRVAACPAAVDENTTFQVEVEYHLDASEIPEAWPEKAATIFCWPNYPTPKSNHQSFGSVPTKRVRPGRGRVTFTCRAPGRDTTANLLLIFWLAPSQRDRWKAWGRRWDANVLIRRASGTLRLGSEKLMNVFTYDQPVRMRATLHDVKSGDVGATWEIRYRVIETGGAKVDEGRVPVRVERNGQEVAIPWRSKRRGCFCLEAEIPGRDEAQATFAVIPPARNATREQRRRFGLNYVFGFGYAGAMHEDVMDENARLARLLGASVCRTWMLWSHFEPEPGLRRWDHWDTIMDLAEKYGLDVNLLAYRYPAWAQDPDSTGARANPWGWSNPPRLDAWSDLVAAIGRRYRARLYAFEFGNEPNPMGAYWNGTAAEYALHLEAGQKAMKSVAPEIITTMAGGAFPQAFFRDVVAAGGGKHVDVVPLHYASADRCDQYKATMKLFGVHKPIWDNETGRGWNSVGKPFREDMRHLDTCDYIATRFTECLSRGVECLMYFLLRSDSWGLCRTDGGVRPGFAAYAVYTSKLTGAAFLGEFPLGARGAGYLFKRDGEPLVIAWGTDDEEAELDVGRTSMTISDLQGNERTLRAPASRARLPVRRRPAYFEGGDLDVLEAYVVPDLTPKRATVLAGDTCEFSLRLKNPYRRRLAGTVNVSAPAGWTTPEPQHFSLAPGANDSRPVIVSCPADATSDRARVEVSLDFSWSKLPRVGRAGELVVVDRSMVGNLVPNGDFEKGGVSPDGWGGVNGRAVAWERAEWPGFGRRCLRLKNAEPGWVTTSAGPFDVKPGQTYLYSAWVWSQRTGGGSNLYQTKRDGNKGRPLYNTQVFALADSAYWKLYTCRYKAPRDIVKIRLSPVIGKAGKGGWARYDNVGLRLYDGTDFMAECVKARRPVRPDGKLDEWDTSSPILLVGENQVAPDEGSRGRYEWSPKNASAVAYAMWDERNFYLAAEVQDQRIVTGRDGDRLVVSLDPARGTAESARASFELVLGEGEYRGTMFRPAARAGLNARTGALAVDGASSACAVRRVPGGMVYEMVLPFGEMKPFVPSFGRKLGFTLSLVDSDGAVGATVRWGGGAGAAWDPSLFGVLTIVD